MNTPLAIQSINIASLVDSLISVSAAFILGSIVGMERQYRQRTAGLRTNVLVAVGASLFVDTAHRLSGDSGAVTVMAYVVSGVGFLGAGVIMREEGNVRGINTAATLWGSAAIGACAGADLLVEAVLGTLFVLLANTMLRPVANRINRQPIDTATVEVTNTLVAIAPKHWQKEAVQFIGKTLELAKLPVRDFSIQPFGDDDVQIDAVIASTSVDNADLERLTKELISGEHINHAFWSASTTD